MYLFLYQLKFCNRKCWEFHFIGLCFFFFYLFPQRADNFTGQELLQAKIFVQKGEMFFS